MQIHSTGPESPLPSSAPKAAAVEDSLVNHVAADLGYCRLDEAPCEEVRLWSNARGSPSAWMWDIADDHQLFQTPVYTSPPSESEALLHTLSRALPNLPHSPHFPQLEDESLRPNLEICFIPNWGIIISSNNRMTVLEQHDLWSVGMTPPVCFRPNLASLLPSP
ncbi:unnamed protein product [Dibothriocephalus latus]|uniref:Uncharacterized protein n=1 Tax=Dibothriocephalus latus TaxID=60516 RepID=A0A3P7P5X0_DIBLA|nr:unnamed protein product [Dibothriocephalus latus]